MSQINTQSQGYSTLDQIQQIVNQITNSVGATNHDLDHRVNHQINNKDKQKRNCPEELKGDDLILNLKVDYAYNIPITGDYQHPLIRITLVNLETGEQLESKETPTQKRAVFSQSESWLEVQVKGTGFDRQVLADTMSEDTSPLIFYPVMTRPSDLRVNRDKNPEFNEEFVWNLNISQIIEQKVVIFFELVDFNVDILSKSQSHLDPTFDDDGFKLIAWSQVIVNGESSFHMSDNKLQFYQYTFDKTFRIKNKPKIPLVFYSFNYPVKHPIQSQLRVKLSHDSISKEKVLKRAEPLCVLHDQDMDLHGSQKTMSWHQLEHTQCSKDEYDTAKLAKPALDGSFERLNDIKKMWNQGNNATPDQIQDRVIMNVDEFSGCYRVKFSNFGKYVALVFPKSQDENQIMVQNLFDKNVKYSTIAHQGIINDLKWSADDEQLLTASSDQTVKVFRTFCGKSNLEIDDQLQVLNCYATLTHPSYCYGAAFDPSKHFFEKDVMVVTICHDGQVRFQKVHLGTEKATNNFEKGFSAKEPLMKISLQDIQQRNENLRDMFLSDLDMHMDTEPADKIQYSLQKTLEEKKIHPNTLAFDAKRNLYVGDSQGIIHQFNCQDLEHIAKRKPFRKNISSNDYIQDNSFIDEEFIGDKITQLTQLDNDTDDNPNADDCSVFLGHCMVVQSCDNALRLVKIDQSNIMNKQVGIRAQKYNMRHTISPNAKYIISGSEDGRVVMWDIVTGICEDTDYTLESNDPVLDVDWNKNLNMIAITQYGDSNSCLFYVAYSEPDPNDQGYTTGDVQQEFIQKYQSKKERGKKGGKRKQQTDLDETLERQSNQSNQNTPMREGNMEVPRADRSKRNIKQ